MSGESSSSIQSVEQKLNVAKQKKETADQAFKLGKVTEGEFASIVVLEERGSITSVQLSGLTTR